MIDLATTRQIILTPLEANKLKAEIEKVFIQVDNETYHGMYSIVKMRERFPLLAEFYITLIGRKHG
jgi:hypothetical protein